MVCTMGIPGGSASSRPHGVYYGVVAGHMEVLQEFHESHPGETRITVPLSCLSSLKPYMCRPATQRGLHGVHN